MMTLLRLSGRIRRIFRRYPKIVHDTLINPRCTQTDRDGCPTVREWKAMRGGRGR